MFMPVSNFAAAQYSLQQATLKAHKLTYSAILQYYDSCVTKNVNYCFYNASAFGFTDALYAQVYKNATIKFGNASAVIPCPLSVILPFMDNTALYTGYSAQVLQALK